MKPLRLLLLTLVVAAVVGASTAAPEASAYRTTSNWYSKTWWFDKGETYRIAWVYPNPSVAFFGTAMPWPVRAAVAASWWTVQQFARRARTLNGCLKIVWIYVNLPVPDMYWGGYCR